MCNFHYLGYYCSPNLSIHQNSTQEPTWNFLVTLIIPTETVCTIAIPPLCATVQAGQNGHLDDGQEGMTRFVLCKKKKTVVVLLDNMKNSSSSTVITVSRNCPRAPDDCSMKAGVEPEIPRCSCLPHIRTVQKLIKVNEYRRWGLGNFVLKKPSDQNM